MLSFLMMSSDKSEEGTQNNHTKKGKNGYVLNQYNLPEIKKSINANTSSGQKNWTVVKVAMKAILLF